MKTLQEITIEANKIYGNKYDYIGLDKSDKKIGYNELISKFASRFKKRNSNYTPILSVKNNDQLKSSF
jgi:ribosomal protein L17